MKVLVAPLDWGLGHATRCVPVIREFLRQGAEVEIAAVKSNAHLFAEIFPELRQRIAPSYNIVYPKHGYNMGLWLLKNSFHLNKVMHYEHQYVEKMVERHGYDLLLSDNRFGFYSKKVCSIYMTHQRRIAFPPALSAFEGIGQIWHASLMKKFDEIWVPDVEEFPGYAGKLSHISHDFKPVKFVGALSRFSDVAYETKAKNDAGKNWIKNSSLDVVAVISGVEPARSQFESQMRDALAKIPGRHMMILGKPFCERNTWTEGNITFHNHLPTEEFAEAVRRARWVVSRGGYSTIMDMAYLGARCIFVPTPGQYEQVVLAHDLSEARYAVHIPAKNLSAKTLMDSFKADVQLPKPPSRNLLFEAVREVLARL